MEFLEVPGLLLKEFYAAILGEGMGMTLCHEGSWLLFDD
jgi:hypothetical protein